MKSKLIILADLGLLKAYRLETPETGSPRLALVSETPYLSAHQHLTDRITDSAGRRNKPGARGGGGPLADSHNLELEVRRRMVKEIAAGVKTLLREAGADGCWLAANKEMLRPLIEALPKTTQARIERTLARDLTKTRPQQLLRYFREAA
jgi:hypothetical protein